MNEIGAQMRVKRESHTFAGVVCGIALPKCDHINNEYMVDIMCGNQP